MIDKIWEATLDNRFRCTVRRTGEYSGNLTIEDGDEQLHSEGVELAYGAKFGPDIDDVRRWQQICSDFVDRLYEQEKGNGDAE